MKKYIVTIMVAVVVGIGAFYGGMQYGSKGVSASAGAQQFGGNFQRGGRNGGGANGGFTGGKVLSKDAQSITIQNGSSTRIVFYSGSTSVMKLATGTIDDVQPGTNIAVMGSPNSDGSLTAQTIQLRNGGGPGAFGQ